MLYLILFDLKYVVLHATAMACLRFQNISLQDDESDKSAVPAMIQKLQGFFVLSSNRRYLFLYFLGTFPLSSRNRIILIFCVCHVYVSCLPSVIFVEHTHRQLEKLLYRSGNLRRTFYFLQLLQKTNQKWLNKN